MKTSPKAFPEKISTSTFNNLKVIQRGPRIRISWEINKIEREKAFYRFYEDPFDNESERGDVFGKTSKYYQIIKSRLPKISVDILTQWFEENFSNRMERNEVLNEWYNDQFYNGSEKKDAFQNLMNDQKIQDYFLIQEKIKPLECKNCKAELDRTVKISFSSKSIIREGNTFYFYLNIPKTDLFFREYELSHLGPNDEILSPVKTFKFKQSNLFPKVPIPSLQIIQIEDEKQKLQFAFGNVIIKKKIIIDKANNLKSYKKEKSKKEIKNPGVKIKKVKRTYTLRISWPKIPNTIAKRLSGEGNYFEAQRNFQVNLYRRRNLETWSEFPINYDSHTNNYFIDKIKLNLNHESNKQKKILQSKNLTYQDPFYVDLQYQNRDTWLYQIRLVDSFGNESIASETKSVNLIKYNLNGQFNIKNCCPIN